MAVSIRLSSIPAGPRRRAAARRCRVTGHKAKPIPRAPTASRLPVPPLLPHRWHCGFCPLTAEGRVPRGKVEGFAIRRSVTRARGSCRRHGPGLITRAHRGAPRECLRSASRTFSKTSRPAAASRFARSSEASWASAGPPRRNARPTTALATVAASLRIVTPAAARTSIAAAGSPEIPVSLWRRGRVWPELAVWDVALA